MATMASTVPCVRKNVYLLVRMKFNEDKLTPSLLFCHYSEINDVSPLGAWLAWTRIPSQPS